MATIRPLARLWRRADDESVAVTNDPPAPLAVVTKGDEPAPLAVVSSPPERDPDRFELKYWIPEEAAADILAYSKHYLVLDPWSVKMGIVSQYNTSCYLETPQMSSYRKHIESAPDRWKLRVRVYGDPPSGPAFFEVKRKMKSVIVKTRAMVPAKFAQSLIEGTYDNLPQHMSPEDKRNLESFLYLQTVTHARPCVHVRAYRESYCTADPLEDVRMTFDRQICFQRAVDGSVNYDPRGWIPIDGEEQHRKKGQHTMLELKFPKIAPFWMGALINRLEMWRVGYSKYCSAVRTLIDQPMNDDLARDFSGGGLSWR